jgi:hypothetical protein
MMSSFYKTYKRINIYKEIRIKILVNNMIQFNINNYLRLFIMKKKMMKNYKIYQELYNSGNQLH